MKIRLMTASAPAVLGAMLLGGCASVPATTETPVVPAAPAYEGPFARPSTLPFHAPDFGAYKDGDYQPAIEAGIEAKRAEVAAIASDPQPPTFENTIVALERAGSLLTRVRNIFDQLISANTNDTLDAAESATSPKLAALDDDIFLNDKLFARVKAVHDSAEGKALTGEDAMLLSTTYDEFVHQGALLPAGQKAELKEMNQRIATLETEFSQKLTNGTAAAAVVFNTKAELAGLSEADIAAAAKHAAEKGAAGKYAIALENTTQQPALAQLKNRESRRKLFEASVNRTSSGGEFDTTAIVSELATLRAKKAALLGQPDFATYQMYDRMVKSPVRAMEFMKGFIPALAATQAREAKELQDHATAQGDKVTLEPWDWAYYAEQVRKAKYDLDDAQIKPYFEVWRTLEEGVFYAATQTYGITFKRRTDLPVYHPTMRVYDVYDKDGSELALFYFDPYSRPNKQGGAWMGNFVEQSYLTGDKPVIYNSINITPPAEGQPALATWDNVTTMFHEFGHGLHGLFASQKYPSLSGTNTARDFVEFPSQFHENFATIPQVLQRYAKHYQTGKTIPSELIEKIKAADKFNQGLGFGEVVEAAMLDMAWHTLTPEQASQQPMAFEAKALQQMNLRTDLIPPRYRTPYFRHIWSNSYEAAYYAYIWTEMLAHDGWDWVEKNGGMTRANGDHIRATFLGQGHSKDYSVMYRNFTGHDPEIGPMLEARGLASKRD